MAWNLQTKRIFEIAVTVCERCGRNIAPVFRFSGGYSSSGRFPWLRKISDRREKGVKFSTSSRTSEFCR
jgi:hypothetical protein